jgi:hypothetical protein
MLLLTTVNPARGPAPAPPCAGDLACRPRTDARGSFECIVVGFFESRSLGLLEAFDEHDVGGALVAARVERPITPVFYCHRRPSPSGSRFAMRASSGCAGTLWRSGSTEQDPPYVRVGPAIPT